MKDAVLSPRLLTATQAGAYLGFKSAWPIRQLAWDGELPVVRLGKRRIAFDRHDLDQFIESRKTREPSLRLE
jgi:excisionase family DNA binding protein